MAHIFVIDDDDQLLDLVEMTLSRQGHQVTLVNRPAEGLEMLRRNRPDGVILDVMMPGMSGHDVCREIRADENLADLPVLILTARTQSVDREAALKSGADDYMSKPFTAKELVERIDGLLSGRQAGARGGQVGIIISLFSLRGGVGRTTLAVNLAAALRQASEREVCLVDLSPSVGQITTHLRLRTRDSWLDFDDPEDLTWEELAAKMAEHQSGVRLLPAPTSPVSSTLPSSLLTEQIFALLHRHVLFTVVDLPPILNPAVDVALRQSDLVIHVVTPEFVAVRVAAKTNRILADPQLNVRQKIHVLNHVTPEPQLPTTAIERGLNARIAFEIGYDAHQPLALAQGVPLPTSNSQSALPAGIGRIAEALWQRVKTSREVSRT